MLFCQACVVPTVIAPPVFIKGDVGIGRVHDASGAHSVFGRCHMYSLDNILERTFITGWVSRVFMILRSILAIGASISVQNCMERVLYMLGFDNPQHEGKRQKEQAQPQTDQE